MADHDDQIGIGFLLALLCVILLGVAFGIGNCSGVNGIAQDCKHFQQFEKDGAIYNCTKIKPAPPPAD